MLSLLKQSSCTSLLLIELHYLNLDGSMARTIVELTVPFTFVAGGSYRVTIDEKICVMSITIEQHHELANRVYPDIQFVGSITSFPADHHGLFEISRARMEFPYIIEPIKVNDIVGEGKVIERDSMFIAAEVECLAYLDRLIRVVKYTTNKYWLSPLSSRDFVINTIVTEPDEGTGKKYSGMDEKMINPFKLIVSEESQSKSIIDRFLLNEEEIPFYNDTFLDSFNAFDTRRFNEAVILINAAFEGFVAYFLIGKLIESGYSEENARKEVQKRFSREKRALHIVMSSDFKEIVGKSLEEDNKDLWDKFQYARNKRKNAVHPYISQISESDASLTISNILMVINWIKKQ
jgi:hypothetical protein